MRTNATKKRLLAGETVFGCWLRYPDPALVEFVGYQGWDFVVFDAEHGTAEPRDCENMVRAAELRDVTPIVRVTTNQAPVILRFMDTGAQGAHVPMVNTRLEAESAVEAIKYGPRGKRGLAASRAASFGQGPPLGEYVAQANSESLVVVHIETKEAIEQLPDIAAVDGIDVVFIGPTDLSHSLGIPGETNHPDVERAMDKIVEATATSTCALGVLVSSTAAACSWRERGARYIAITLEALIRESSRGFLSTVRT